LFSQKLLFTFHYLKITFVLKVKNIINMMNISKSNTKQTGSKIINIWSGGKVEISQK